MNTELIERPSQALEQVDPLPNAVYTIEAAARLAGLSRRTILVYCKYGLISPLMDPVCDGYCFSEESVRELRKIEYLRNVRGINLPGIKMIFALMDEVRRLEAEARRSRH